MFDPSLLRLSRIQLDRSQLRESLASALPKLSSSTVWSTKRMVGADGTDKTSQFAETEQNEAQLGGLGTTEGRGSIWSYKGKEKDSTYLLQF